MFENQQEEQTLRRLTKRKITKTVFVPARKCVLCFIFSHVGSNDAPLNYSWQESKKRIHINTMQSIFLTPLWLWKQSQKSSTLKENVDPEQGYNHAKFERYCLNSDQKKKRQFQSFFQMRNYVNYPPWTCVKKWQSWSNWCDQQLNKVST